MSLTLTQGDSRGGGASGLSGNWKREVMSGEGEVQAATQDEGDPGGGGRYLFFLVFSLCFASSLG